MATSFSRLVLCWALVKAWSITAALDFEEEVLAVGIDNECHDSIHEGDQGTECALNALQLGTSRIETSDIDLPPFVIKINDKLSNTVVPNLNEKFPGDIKLKNMDPLALPYNPDTKLQMETLNGLSTLHIQSMKATGLQPPSDATGGLAKLQMSLAAYFVSNLLVVSSLGKHERPVTFTFDNVHFSTEGIQAMIDPATKTITKFVVPDIPVTIGGQSVDVGGGNMFRHLIEKKVGNKLEEISIKVSGMLSKKITAAVEKMLEAKCPLNLSEAKNYSA